MNKLTLIFIFVFQIAFSQLQTINVTPSVTDSNINTYTDASQQEVHICYKNTAVSARNELLIFLPGSGGKPNGNDYFDKLAANLGYDVIGLMYPNNPSIGSLCDIDTDPDCYLKTRLEIIDGIDRTTLVNVNASNSIENRIIKCIKYLNINYPSQNWGQYLDINDAIIWNKIAIAGHSQGGGHAALIAKNHQVSRVLCFASPKDNYRTPTVANPQYLGIIAPWINQNNLTPKENYFTFTHAADNTGATPAEQLAIFNLLGLNQIAPYIIVDSNSSPYNESRILVTNLSTANGTTINPHGCVLVDNAVPNIQSAGTNIYQQPWTYMLTHSTTLLNENFEINNQKQLVYPNPFSNKINLKNDFGNEELTLINTLGQVVFSGKNIQENDFSNLKRGVYFIFKTNERDCFQRLIKE
jgi:pimeloyl-ACP methyl ester carboxylesterase